MLALYDVSFAYGERTVLKNLNLNIDKGAWLNIFGENGSGKSTLAKLCGGLLLPDAGRVVVGGMDTAKAEELAALRQGVAFVFQNPENQVVGATVEEDVAFGVENLGLPRSEVLARTDEALARFGLTGLRKREPHLLSGGELQKTALAGAYVMRPKLLILDEACAMLDPGSREQIWAEIVTLREETGLTVVSVSHAPEEVRFGDHLLYLHDGGVEVILGD